MKRYFTDIYESVSSILGGMSITLVHLFKARNDNVTLQYPEEKWPRPERNSKIKSTVIDLSHRGQYLNYQEWLEHQTLTILLQSHLAHQEQ
jgi:hypothetical protein